LAKIGGVDGLWRDEKELNQVWARENPYKQYVPECCDHFEKGKPKQQKHEGKEESPKGNMLNTSMEDYGEWKVLKRKLLEEKKDSQKKRTLLQFWARKSTRW